MRGADLARALVLTLAASSALAGESEIVDRIRAVFDADEAERGSLLRAIETDPAWAPDRLSEWLTLAVRHEPIRPGRSGFRVALPDGSERTVIARMPAGYDPTRRWPLLVVYHAGGTGADWALHWIEGLLGPSIERFVVVAPDHYRQTGLDAPPPFTGEQGLVLDAALRLFSIDPDRVHVAGYSLGGYTAWHVATIFGDRLASATAVAATLGPPLGDDGVAEALLANLTVPVWNVWGGRDLLEVPDAGGTVRGTIAGCNRRLAERTAALDLPVHHRVIGSRGHLGVRPRRRWLLEALERRRGPAPATIDHRFRHLFQGRAAWVEATRWRGPSWGEDLPPAGERASMLGRIRGRRGPAGVELETRHVGRLAVCLDRATLEADGAWSVRVNGRPLDLPRPVADLAVALDEAARTRDLARPCWARLEIDLDRDGIPDAP